MVQPNPIKVSSVPGLAVGDFSPPANDPNYVFKGLYSSAVTYGRNNVVLYTDGKGYVSLQAGNLNHTPSSSAAWWEVHPIG